jgi:putative transposase
MRRKLVTTDSNHELKPSIAPSHTYCVCAAGNGQAICREGPNLLEQKFDSQTPNTVWLANITSMTPPLGIMLRITLPGKGRRLALFGWHQRHGHAEGEIVGWAMEDHMRAKLCCDALEMAPGRRGPVAGLIHHSDRGSQYEPDCVYRRRFRSYSAAIVTGIILS